MQIFNFLKLKTFKNYKSIIPISAFHWRNSKIWSKQMKFCMRLTKTFTNWLFIKYVYVAIYKFSAKIFHIILKNNNLSSKFLWKDLQIICQNRNFRQTYTKYHNIRSNNFGDTSKKLPTLGYSSFSFLFLKHSQIKYLFSMYNLFSMYIHYKQIDKNQ